MLTTHSNIMHRARNAITIDRRRNCSSSIDILQMITLNETAAVAASGQEAHHNCPQAQCSSSDAL